MGEFTLESKPKPDGPGPVRMRRSIEEADWLKQLGMQEYIQRLTEKWC
jgi:hypothetical protein